MPTNQFLTLAEDERWIKEYQISIYKYLWPVYGYLAVTNKRLILFAEGGLEKTYHMDEVRIDKITGVDFMFKPRFLIGIIFGLIMVIVGAVLSVLEQFEIGFTMLTAGIPILAASIIKRFRLIVSVTGLYKESPEFVVGDRNSVARVGLSKGRTGSGHFLGRPGRDAVLCAQELGAVILDVQKKGTTSVGVSEYMGGFGQSMPGYSGYQSPPPPPPPEDRYPRF